MRNISLKSVPARLSVTLLLLMGSISASAQYYLNVYEKSGSNNQYEIANLDSVSISDVKEYTPVLTVLRISQSQVNIETGASTTLTVKGYDADGTEMTLEDLKWKSSDYSVASVDENGVVRTYQSGNVDIVASLGDVTDTCTVIIKDHVYTLQEVVKLSLDKVALNVETGDGDSLSIRGFAADEVEIPLSNIQWETDNSSVATVTDNGVVKTLGSGKAHIIASLGNVSDTCTVTVVDHIYTLADVVKIAINKDTLNLETGQNATLSAVGMAATGVEIPLKNILWKSCNTAVATIDENGVVKTFNNGKTVITASFGIISDTCVLVVVDHVYTIDEVVKISIDKSYLNLETGDGDTLTIKGFASNNVEIPLNGVVWKSDKTDVATVNNGVIETLTEGTAHIIALLGSITDTCTVTVKNKYADAGLYLGVIGFNNELYTKSISLLNSGTNAQLESFINGLKIDKQTKLYYAVDRAIDALHGVGVPENLSTVTMVTFTDGIDEGSRDEKDLSTTEYENYLKNRISTDSIAGVPITAYSIGMIGSDLRGDNDLIGDFRKILKKIASSDSLAMEVDSIQELENRFEHIAGSLTNTINFQTVTVDIPRTDDNDSVRFTFDIVGVKNADNEMIYAPATTSSLYIEGVYIETGKMEDGSKRYFLKDLKYCGIDTLSYSMVEGVRIAEGDNKGLIEFTFNQVLPKNNKIISKDKILEWKKKESYSSWRRNSEFVNDNLPDILTERSSAIIVLVLDCSFSLGSDFAEVKKQAKSFINTLYNSYYNNLSGDNNDNNNGDNDNPSGPSYEYVDLGLSVKWATHNVGATKPEEYGGYFAWGELYTRNDYYKWSTYKLCNGSSSTMTKYNNSSSYGTVDNKTTLEMSDDVARQKWGGNWRMPTVDEFNELLNNCTWTWTTQNGVNGYRVTSKKSGYTDCSIFLPAAGSRSNTSLRYAGSDGRYWSSSLYTSVPNDAWELYINSSAVRRTRNYYRYVGLSVRPVCP